MKSIAIVELYQHDELLDHFLSLFEGTEVKVNVFCSTYVYHSLSKLHLTSNINWTILEMDQSISNFLSDQNDLIKKNDIILLTTVFTDFESFRKLIINKKSILIIHNAHWQLMPNKHIWLKSKTFFRDGYRLLKDIFTSKISSRKNLLDAVTFLGVGSIEMEKYLKANTDLKNMLKEKIHYLPFTHFKTSVKNLSKINLVIPGIVEDQNRDYNIVWNALNNILPKIKNDLHLTLLGAGNNSSGRKIIHLFKKLQAKNLSLKSFEGNVTFDTYHAEIQKASLLIIPAKQHTKFHKSIELNGHSKIMGTANDIIKYGIKAALPSYYPTPSYLSELITKYDDQTNLEHIILNHIETQNDTEPNTAIEQLINYHSKEKCLQEFLTKFSL